LRREILPYSPHLKEIAKKLRQNMTFSEVKLWNELKNGKTLAYDFDRQRPIGNYIVDFYCKDLGLALEVDGITHIHEQAALADKLRQDELEFLGVAFLRFDALLIVNKIESVVKEIQNWILEYESKNGITEFVKRKRNKLLKEENPPLPLQGGDATHSAHFSKKLLTNSSPPLEGRRLR